MEHYPAHSKETKLWRLPGAKSLGHQCSHCTFASNGPKPVHSPGPGSSWCCLLYLFGLKGCFFFFFFCLQVAPASQPLCAFEWEDSHTGWKRQFTWTCLPQGFKNSPTLFEDALAADLARFPYRKHTCVVLQHVDDILTGGVLQKEIVAKLKPSSAICWPLALVTWKKPQTCEQKSQIFRIWLKTRAPELRSRKKSSVPFTAWLQNGS